MKLLRNVYYLCVKLETKDYTCLSRKYFTNTCELQANYEVLYFYILISLSAFTFWYRQSTWKT